MKARRWNRIFIVIKNGEKQKYQNCEEKKNIGCGIISKLPLVRQYFWVSITTLCKLAEDNELWDQHIQTSVFIQWIVSKKGKVQY